MFQKCIYSVWPGEKHFYAMSEWNDYSDFFLLLLVVAGLGEERLVLSTATLGKNPYKSYLDNMPHTYLVAMAPVHKFKQKK